jgi:hypothetical protein
VRVGLRRQRVGHLVAGDRLARQRVAIVLVTQKPAGAY